MLPTPPSRDAPWRSTRVRWTIAALLVVLAALPRAYRLGEESLTGDEDLTWLAAAAVADGEGAVMPSGMPYRRALPFTWANAATLALLGRDDNASVRLVAAAAGSLTPGVVFLAGARLVAPPVALVGAVVLAVSEWHVSRSRHGRMYPVLALTFFLSGVLFWRWAREGGVGLGTAAVAVLGLTVALHLLGIPAAQTALFALVLPGALAVPAWAILGVVASSTAVLYHLNRIVVQAPYGMWALPRGYLLDGRTAPVGPVGIGHAPHLALVALGLAIGVWWAARSRLATAEESRRPIQRLADAAALVAVAVAVAHGLLVAGALAAVVALLLRPRSPTRFFREEGFPVAVVCTVGLGWLSYALADGGVETGLRRVAGYPYIYLRALWSVSPALVALFLVGSLGLMWRRQESTDPESPDAITHNSGLRAAALAAWLPLAGLGFAAPHGPARYAFMLLPFMALVSAWPLTLLARAAVHAWRADADAPRTAALALAVVLVGVVPGHGLLPAWRAAHVDYASTVDPLPSDHETPGRFLADGLRPGDVVIAEDETMTYVYAGQVDYWFRRAGDARSFLHLGADGVPRSKYTGAGLVSSPAGVREVVRAAQGRVWFVTSRETAVAPRFYHSPDQAAWLAELQAERAPVVVGRDGSSALYCLNC